MRVAQPTAEVDTRFSSEGAAPAKWADVSDRLQRAEIFWISTVRSDGRPHVTPLISVYLGDALYFCTGPDERKARNLARTASSRQAATSSTRASTSSSRATPGRSRTTRNSAESRVSTSRSTARNGDSGYRTALRARARKWDRARVRARTKKGVRLPQR